MRFAVKTAPQHTTWTDMLVKSGPFALLSLLAAAAVYTVIELRGATGAYRRTMSRTLIVEAVFGIAVAIFTVLASELLIRGSGVGAFMFDALDNGQTVTVFAVATIVAAAGFVLDAAYVFAARRALPWLEGEL